MKLDPIPESEFSPPNDDTVCEYGEVSFLIKKFYIYIYLYYS